MNETMTLALALVHEGGVGFLVAGYIDPGTAGFVVVSVLGFLASIGYLLRDYGARLKQRLVHNRPAEPEDNVPAQTPRPGP